MPGNELIRASIFHVIGNPWRDDATLAAFEDGGLLIDKGRIVACGPFDAVRAQASAAVLSDWRGEFLLPGFVDTHVHFPQLRIVGQPGRSLLDWLEHVALPEEARMADAAYARETARRFVRALAAHGTTTASVFGAHFPGAVASLFDAAATTGVRIAAGLVLSDRGLRPALHVTPDEAYADSVALIERYHGRGRLMYSVTPRFALSTTDAMLEVCQTLLAEHPTTKFQTHINENQAEVAEVARLFPWADDYLAVYERFALCGRRAVMAHNVHATASELQRLAATETAVAHCPSSNAALGSGVFPMRRHLDAGVRFALGTDVGAGMGFSLMREAVQARLFQHVAAESIAIGAAQMLYLSTLAGAEALGVEDETGNLAPGKSADFVRLRVPDHSVLASALERVKSPADMLSALLTLAGQECVREVRVSGEVIWTSGAPG